MIPESVVHSDPEVMGGEPVFVGTRVPVQSLFDYLEGGETLNEFLRQFPTVKHEQTIAALEMARTAVISSARSTAVRVLLDENLPVSLAAELVGHDVASVAGLGWRGIKNGELLRVVA